MAAGDPRVALAVERTFLAWIRSGLAMMGFGFVVARFGFFLNEVAGREGVDVTPTSGSLSVPIGILLVLVGVGVQVGAATRYRTQLRRLEGSAPPAFLRPTFPMTIAGLLIVVGVVVTVHLMLRLLR